MTLQRQAVSGPARAILLGGCGGDPTVGQQGQLLRGPPTKILCGLALSGPFVGRVQIRLRAPCGIAPFIGGGPVRGPQNTVYWVVVGTEILEFLHFLMVCFTTVLEGLLTGLRARWVYCLLLA